MTHNLLTHLNIRVKIKYVNLSKIRIRFTESIKYVAFFNFVFCHELFTKVAKKNITYILFVGYALVMLFLKEYRDDIKDRYERRNDPRDPYDFSQYGRYEFFLYTTCVGVIIAIVSLVWSFI